jgi:alpha-methylacyl-CoA racemase
MPAALDGLKILDLSRLLPGPYCGLILADLGAEVVKIEDPNGGDYLRWMLPQWGDYSVFYMLLNRNKKSLTLDLKNPRGVEIFKKLVAEADVVLESFRPGVMDRLGVGYEQLKEVNPGLIFCSISGYGATGPYREKAGHDLNYAAIAGLLSISGRPGQPPAPLPIQVADMAGGSLFAAVGILAALMRRGKTGEGCYIDSSMTDGAAALGILNFAALWGENRVPRQGEEQLNGQFACYEVYQTADGKFLSVGALEPKFFERFCNAVGRPELLGRQFDSGDKGKALKQELAEIVAGKTIEEWERLLEDKDCCCEPVKDYAQAEQDPQLNERGMFFELEVPKLGKIKQLNTPFNMPGCRRTENTPPPALGENTAELLAALGLSAREIASLKDDKVI